LTILQRAAVAAILVIAVAAGAPLSHAHVVLGSTTLRLLTLQSDFAARVRILDPAAVFELKDPLLRETVVVAEVLEALKGEYVEKELRFVQRGHGVVSYGKGDEVVLFVHHIARNPELANSPIVQHLHWVSEQETGSKFALDAGNRDAFAAAVRAYAALEALPAEAQPDALRRITVEMLTSPHADLASSALRDLVLSADAPIVSAEDLPLLEPVLDSPATPIGLRIGLLAELERRKLVVGPPRWVALLRTTTGPEQLAVVRAAGVHPSLEVAEELLKLLDSKDVQLVSTAAVALGTLRYDGAVAPLAKLLASEEPRIRMAAIRGLGKVGSPAALAVLDEAAASHPDLATRKRAGAEVTVLRGARE
jgi:hypothetical protein